MTRCSLISLSVPILTNDAHLSHSFIYSPQLKGEGTGGLPEFIANLPADDIVWGAVKVVAVDNRGNLVSRRPKFVSVKVCVLMLVV